MRKTMGAGMLAAVVLAVELVPARGVEDEAINQAIDKGIAALKALGAGGAWPGEGAGGGAHVAMGATALAGLTLLECNISAEDPAVARAAETVRSLVPDCRYTYALALSVLFLDRLGEPKDIPLIEAMAMRLIAGQAESGGWDYQCPEVVGVEELRAHLKRQAELVARSGLPKPGEGGRSAKDLPPFIAEHLAKIVRTTNPAVAKGGDNSNTQFAALALWTARRYGLPVDDVMMRLERRFRSGQNRDGGWSYEASYLMGRSTPTMTCAGILALEISHGLSGDAKKPRDPDKDQQLTIALSALGTCLTPIAKAEGKDYYFLWSVERVCVILGRNKLGNTDWYKWGAEILVKSQGPDGLWRGEFAKSGADTCFALLFLKRANLARDLSARIRSKKGDRELRAGGSKDVDKKPGGEGDTEKPKPAEAKAPAPLGNTPAARLAKQVLQAPEADRPALLRKYRTSRGPEYTEALALASSRLEGDAQVKAREALAGRLAGFAPKTLVELLKNEDAEMRRAAAKVCATKRQLASTTIPALIQLLRDPEDIVKEAAHESLKTLTGLNLGAAPEPWEDWLKKNGGR